MLNMLNDEDLLMMQRNNEVLRLMNHIAEMQLSLPNFTGNERKMLEETIMESKELLSSIYY